MSAGSIIKRVGKKGAISWLLKYDTKGPNGERLQQYATASNCTRREAQEKLRELMSHVDKGTHVDRSEVTVSEWIAERLAIGKQSRKTLERYGQLACYVDRHIGSIKLQQLRSGHIERFYTDLERSGGKNGRRLSLRTVKHTHRLLSKVLTAAVNLRAISENPITRLPDESKPKPAPSRAVPFKPVDALTGMLASMKAAGDWLYPIAQLGSVTGMRRGELLALRWKDIDFDGNTISVREALDETKAGVEFKVPKTPESLRTIPVSRMLLAELGTYWKQCAEGALACGVRLTAEHLVFPAAPYTPDRPRVPMAVTQAFSERLRKYKLKAKGLTFHSLRHTHASVLLNRGVNLKIVQTRLGHAKPSITLDTYSHLMEDNQQQAVDATEAIFGQGGAG